MNPNSTHQLWSRWSWTVYPGRRVALPFEPVKLTIANFTRTLFGSAGQMRIIERVNYYVIDLRTEGRPAHDPDFVSLTARQFRDFFVRCFGVHTRVMLTGPKIEAGSFQDGRPPTQLVILPPLSIKD
jgi:hypothetical protein